MTNNEFAKHLAQSAIDYIIAHQDDANKCLGFAWVQLAMIAGYTEKAPWHAKVEEV